jgi:cob(I)alamin adenosyltransferase
MSTNEAANDDELAEMDDVAFLSLCRTVRRVAERTPTDELSAKAKAKLEQVNAEFLRRAGMAWRDAS